MPVIGNRQLFGERLQARACTLRGGLANSLDQCDGVGERNGRDHELR